MMRLTLTSLFSLLLAGVSLAAVRIEPTDGQDGKTFERREWRVRIDGNFANPFDPDEIAVDATFVGPRDQKLTIPAFWMTKPDGRDGGFFIRFSPTAAGHWKLRVISNHRGDSSKSDELDFDVVASSDRGFVRRSPDSPYYCQYDSGDPYFLIGPNIAWGTRKELTSYDPMFTKLSAAGGNFARVWMSDPNYMTETKELGLGRYDQAACANYDTIFESAQRHGIACMVTFNNYRDLRERDNWGPCPWQSLPFAASNGGPCTQPADFISRADCQKLYRQRLRYIVARYTAFTSVAFWEFFNEQTFAEVPIPPSWTIGMATYLHSVDPYQHIVTNSYGGAGEPAVWKSDEIGLTQAHQYGGEATPDAVAEIIANVAEHRPFNKPFLLAELGISAEHSDIDYDKAGSGTNLHNGLWAAMMSGACGGAANWWWDSYIEPKNLWEAYHGAAIFSQQIDWPRRHFEVIKVPAAVMVDPPTPETFSDSTLAASGGWGKSHGQTVMLEPNGQSQHALPHYIFGSGHADLQTPTKIDVTIPAGGSELVLRTSRVSDAAVVRVLIDNEPKADFLISLLADGEPKSAPATRSSRHRRDPDQPALQGPVKKEFTVSIPEGHHTIAIQNLGTDWFMLDSVTLRKTKSSRFADLEALAMSDPGTGEVIAWLHDPASNWRSEYDGQSSRIVPPAKIVIPTPASGNYDVQWWDTRAGKMISTVGALSADGKLLLTSPPIDRDVALRAVRR